MTLPIHTVKHVKSSYRKIQIITICLTVLTLTAALLAAISGIQLVNLEKQQSAEIVQKASPPAIVDDALNKQIEDLKTELSKEKDASNKLKSRIAVLNKQIASLKQTIQAPAQPVPASEPSRNMQTPSTPAPVKQSAAPPTTTPKPVPAAVPIAQPTKTEPVAPKPGVIPVPEAPGKTTDAPSTNATETPLPTIKPSVEKTPPSPEKTPPDEQNPDRPSTTKSNTEPAQSTDPPAPAQVPPPASPDQKAADSQKSTSPD